MQIFRILLILIMGSLCFGEADLESVLDRVSQAQSKIETLRASFVQEKQSDFFAENVTSSGVLYYKAPDSIRWEYESPSKIIILITHETVTFYDVEQKKAERTVVGRVRKKIQQYMMATEPLEKLKRYFTIYFAEKEKEGRYYLRLVPAVRKIEKHLSEVNIEVDRELNLPVSVAYTDSDGDLTRYKLHGIVINEPIDPEKFRLDLPSDVQIQEFRLKP
ncbi:MAG TPA: outer membrane lipoprotein carrier protein LolA [Thermoanaerobaculia bacterium]|nr:outer membrane lipoprotein carrier protein LolA [Thermoanaerobaculia bacterium]HUM30479.1 outer membrane lipoprotein carrier protein LolA [Thermoanaerobaculia bacterium]HXK68654.1 outer membrane lipoprotein carrier protein LolA [Thermoanaerobaculia bacterium]